MRRALATAMVRRTFRDFSATGYPKLVERYAPRFEYRFAGEHALGGVRRTRSTLTAWFGRLFSLVPDGQARVREVFVAGWPWRMKLLVLAEVRSVALDYRNDMVQEIEMRWGRITRMWTLEDTQKLVGMLDKAAANGSSAAAAPPLNDPPN
jgi:ketosteroid isomerase-like protein